MARKLRLAFSVLIVVAFCYQVVQAEECRMVGCGIGYVFLPTTHNGTGRYLLGNHRCAPPIGVHSFKENALPKVNDVVTVKANIKGLFSEQEIEAHIDDFQPPYIDPSQRIDTCVAEWHEPEPNVGMTLRAGDKLRVLGYRTFVGHHTHILPATALVPNPKPSTYPQQLIFILVAPE